MYTSVGALIHVFWICSFLSFLSIVMTTFIERFSVVFKCSLTLWASFAAFLIGKKLIWQNSSKARSLVNTKIKANHLKKIRKNKNNSSEFLNLYTDDIILLFKFRINLGLVIRTVPRPPGWFTIGAKFIRTNVPISRLPCTDNETLMYFITLKMLYSCFNSNHGNFCLDFSGGCPRLFLLSPGCKIPVNIMIHFLK